MILLHKLAFSAEIERERLQGSVITPSVHVTRLTPIDAVLIMHDLVEFARVRRGRGETKISGGMRLET